MTSTTLSPESDSQARRNVRVLVAAQAILGAQMPVNFVLGGLLGKVLAPSACLATLPISVIVLGSMISAPLLANFMQVHGRKAGFMLGALGGAAGAVLVVLAIFERSFALMLAGSALTGIYMSAQGFYRFAATDTASDSYRPRAVSWVMAGGLLSAIIGPQIVNLFTDAADIPFLGAYLAVIVLNLAGMTLFLGLDIPKPPAPKPGDARGRTRAELLADPRILVAMICAMVSYALMNLVMTSTPLAVVGCGFATEDASHVVSAHVLAMFAPSFFTGRLINRFGAPRIIAAGLAILFAAGVVALSGVELTHFFGALILLGLGWNFGYIGATALLTASHSPAERARVQGMNDFAVFGMVTVASLASGFLMNCAGASAVAGWHAVSYAMIPFLTLAGGALVWFALRLRTA
ncbi:MFS transporter [Oceanicella sp. SM1341]|uniref:MFS transporter n=1 Tax=Oceanicella sp. SM1341 TaxID=1548889 RepID=UPI000E554DB0|nr:MFS transporter [Oceanicella sp. SM1341]